MSNSFALTVAPANYRARPRVSLAPHLIADTAGNPFARRRALGRALVLACFIAGAFVAGELVALIAAGVL